MELGGDTATQVEPRLYLFFIDYDLKGFAGTVTHGCCARTTQPKMQHFGDPIFANLAIQDGHASRVRQPRQLKRD